MYLFPLDLRVSDRMSRNLLHDISSKREVVKRLVANVLVVNVKGESVSVLSSKNLVAKIQVANVSVAKWERSSWKRSKRQVANVEEHLGKEQMYAHRPRGPKNTYCMSILGD